MALLAAGAGCAPFGDDEAEPAAVDEATIAAAFAGFLAARDIDCEIGFERARVGRRGIEAVSGVGCLNSDGTLSAPEGAGDILRVEAGSSGGARSFAENSGRLARALADISPLPGSIRYNTVAAPFLVDEDALVMWADAFTFTDASAPFLRELRDTCTCGEIVEG